MYSSVIFMYSVTSTHILSFHVHNIEFWLDEPHYSETSE